MHRLIAILPVVCLALAAGGGEPLTETQRAELPQYFGFGPMQIYKLERGIQSLELADLNGDGRTDIILWNPRKSRFELFYQPEPGAPAAPAEPRDRNEVPDQGNLRKEKVPVSYRVAALKVADLTGDGRADIVFFGEPREVVILPGRPEGGFGAPEGIRAPDGEPRGTFLSVGDYNGDGRTDVALLGQEVLQIFPQKPAGGLGHPLRLVHGIKEPRLMLTADLNGDGRSDLVIGADEDRYGVYAYLQGEDGTFSALRRIKIPKLRSMTFGPGPAGDDLFAVEATTSRLKLYRWAVPEEVGGAREWPQRLYSYPFKITSKRLALTLGDVTGDGRPDCVAADPDGAQLILFAGTADGFGAGKPFPGLLKTVDLQVADIDGDGRAELLSVSAAEKTLGVSRFENGRLTFPKPLPVRGQPLVAAVTPWPAASRGCAVAYVARDVDQSGETSAEEEDEEEEEEEDEGRDGGGAWIRLLDVPAGRELGAWPAGPLDDAPSGLRFVDVDQDGRADVLLFSRFAPLQVYLQTEAGGFAAFEGPGTRAGLVRHASLQASCVADVTGDGRPELLLARKGLARALVVQDGRWTVIDQCNAENANAEITGLAALGGESGDLTLVMYDRKGRELLVLRRGEDRTFGVDRSFPVGNYALSAMQTLRFGPDGRPALLLADARRLAVFSPGEVAPTLVEQRSYESDAKEAWLGDAVPCDVNHDGVRDVAAVDMRKAAVEILTTAPDGSFVRAVRFQVFQGKRFTDDPDDYGEPREVLAGDVTGDGIDDLVLLVHDRLIVYPGQ